MEYGNRNRAYLGESTERVVGCGVVRRVTQCVSGLVCEPSKLGRLYNSSHNYEFQCKKSYVIEVWKNTYHVVLERATLRLDGAMLHQFVVVIDNVIVVVGVQYLGYVGLGIG
jgi:hypothetical protein